ncbi:MAG: TlyA family RNA methyltransferase [Oscillospiraceae bacterium]
MRLDVYLVENKIVSGRERAKEHIKKGDVKVNGAVMVKPAYDVVPEDNVEFTGERLKYVGRGGLKLEKAVTEFALDLDGKICLDIGASTGGFTDCMLKNGAAFVYAVDVGTGQLDESLVSDSRVKNMEKTNFADTRPEDYEPAPEFFSADVSFVSLKVIIPRLMEIMPEEGRAVLLIKPQFEAGRSNIGKRGIVKDRKVHVSVINDIISFCKLSGAAVCGLTYSPVTGGDGNIEYLLYIKPCSAAADKAVDVKKIVSDAFSKLH